MSTAFSALRNGCADARPEDLDVVKCDEIKPYCLKCTKFGRKCDGYGPKPKENKNERKKSEGMVVIRPRPLLTLYNPKLAIPGNADERRYFQLFSQTTTLELCGYFDSIFWAQTVLQASLNEASIRHAVTTVAALSRMAEETPKNSQAMGISKVKDEHYRFGI